MKIKLIESNGCSKLTYGGHEIFSHSEKEPFISVAEGILEFYDRRGSFTVKEIINKEYNLSAISAQEEKDGLLLVFSCQDIAIKLKVTEHNGIINLIPEGKGTFNRVTFNFSGNSDEGIFGLGEQFRRLNHKGYKVENMVSEHISLKPIIQKSIAPFKWFKYKPKDKVKTYAPMSTFMSSKLYSIRVDVQAYGIQDFSGKNNSLSYWELPKSIKYVTGSSYKEISKKLSNARPYLPDWIREGMVLGIQGGIDYTVSQAFKMLDSGAKISGVWCQDWSGKKITVAGKQVYWNWEVSEEMYPNLKERIKELKARGVHFLGYINPYLVVGSPMYEFCRSKGYLVTDMNGEVYNFKTTTFPAGMMDLTNYEMVDYLKNTIIKKNVIELGISGWMADFGEYLPAGVKLKNGVDSSYMHNVWTTLWAKYNREAIEESGADKEVFFFTRSGYNNSEHYTSIMWNGDQHTDYSPDYGMPCVIPASVNLGMSGMTLVHSDIGGYITFKALKRDAELFIRWMSMNTFSPMMRTHETPRPEENAQYDTPEVIKYTVHYSTIHKMLSPYIKEVIKQANEGIPALRAPFYSYNDYSLYKEDYVYMFGDDVFVAPVLSPNVGTRELDLPKDEWVHLFTGVSYSGGNIKVDAPLDKPPVFYKKSSEFRELFQSITKYCIDKE